MGSMFQAFKRKAGLRALAGTIRSYAKEGKLAVTDMRPRLDYNPRCQATWAILSQMVASHMRTVFSIPQHRKYMRSRYPSKPWLAEAAAPEMENLQSLRSGFVLRTLEDVASSSMINLGERQAYDLCSC
ncbi:uncharacterized protein EI90DRAFT_497368 [Cantharellus anzutake]|uniref:uncharacterized protein n=1 Tax=Cantharellus anzutake TaxID=1750568 RepID=UPI00190846E0|nr:uncharacterized protein EI90DRAFT_497368 [Cantharellus anzutake]KAF8334006.1 hypothetical protein EI90DRAFT_497368 [Cantharellus anzutake]